LSLTFVESNIYDGLSSCFLFNSSSPYPFLFTLYSILFDSIRFYSTGLPLRHEPKRSAVLPIGRQRWHVLLVANLRPAQSNLSGRSARPIVNCQNLGNCFAHTSIRKSALYISMLIKLDFYFAPRLPVKKTWRQY